MKRIIYAALACLTFASCEDFLDKQPIEQIGTDEYFKNEGALEKYTNGFLNSYTPGSGDITRGDGNCDIIEVKQTSSYLFQPVWNPSLQGGWSTGTWNFVYYINTFLDRMHEAQGVSEAAFAHYEGTARFWRAWNYFELVKTFGGVPWYDHVVSNNSHEDLYKPRDSREYVMDKVLEDLTFASTYCLADAKYTKGSALINKWVALAFKSRVCLYEGTFRKYHSREPSSDKPWQNDVYNADNKFLREAAAAAKEIMDKGPFSLVTGDVKTAYRSLFTSAGLLTQEVIFGREYSKELSAFHETSWYYYSPTYGTKIAMTKKFMNTYLTTKGTPFTDIDGYKTIDFIHEFDGRDARMAQTVISPSYQMKISGRTVPYSPNWKVTRTGYHPIKWSIDDDADNVLSKAASWNSLPIIRYAEVLLNYAEAKAELGEMDAAVWDQTIAPLRSRAGVTSVIPAKADPYMEAYFLNTVTDKWILEVRRERGIELCLEMGLRWDDDMRWHMGDLLTSDNNPWTGIYIGSTSYTYDYTGLSTDDNGDPVPDFYIRPGEDTEHSIAISNTGANQTFSLNGEGNIVWEYRRVWSEKKYLRPIPLTAITRNPNLEQNALWK